MSNEIVIRRARPQDVGAMVAFINQAGRGKAKIDRAQLLESFGDQGYMLAEQAGELRALVAWNTEDFIARISRVIVFPARFRSTVGKALMEAVCGAAYELMCEVALLFPPEDASGRTRQFFRSCGFEAIEMDDLIPAWRRAAWQSMPDNSFIMLRKLREKRVMRPV